MKKQHLIESIQSFLASDNASDQKAMYHPEEIKVHLNNVFSQMVYNAWLNGKKYSDLSQLDAWSRTYPCPVLSQTGANAHAFLPFAPIQLPDNSSVRQVCDNADNTNVFAIMEATANVVFAELDVNDMDDTPVWSLEQSNLFTGTGQSSHLLRLRKLPMAPATLITNVDVMLIVGLENLDDYDEVSMPNEQADTIIRQVIDLMSKKPVPDTSNDQVIQK